MVFLSLERIGKNVTEVRIIVISVSAKDEDPTGKIGASAKDEE